MQLLSFLYSKGIGKNICLHVYKNQGKVLYALPTVGIPVTTLGCHNFFFLPEIFTCKIATLMVTSSLGSCSKKVAKLFWYCPYSHDIGVSTYIVYSKYVVSLVVILTLSKNRFVIGLLAG